jgi:rhodanese-related sulfurtransferase
MSTEDFEGRDAIDVRELAELRRADRPHLVLDVREADELEICRLEGAMHIPMARVPARTGELPRQQPLVVMCHRGGRSRAVVQFLRRAGFENALNLEGGIDAWASEVDSSMAQY